MIIDAITHKAGDLTRKVRTLMEEKLEATTEAEASELVERINETQQEIAALGLEVQERINRDAKAIQDLQQLRFLLSQWTAEKLRQRSKVIPVGET